MPFSIHNALTNAQMEYNLDHCANTTVGDEKYQFYCQTQSNLEGSCTKIPSQYLTNGLDCPSMATDAWLDKVYAETGLNCGINCYYYGYGIPSINIPTFNIPTIDIPTISYSTDYYTTTTPYISVPDSTAVNTFVPISNASSVSSASPTSISPPASSASGLSSVSTPVIGSGSTISSAQNTSPNMLLLTVLLLKETEYCYYNERANYFVSKIY
ncbi:hypothetical protein K501DRAFT_310923 [Backusella circina FSU 941]|nr:hypothetical protein K501DRAFT_310923 [Backusella circina FSU 941]